MKCMIERQILLSKTLWKQSISSSWIVQLSHYTQHIFLGSIFCRYTTMYSKYSICIMYNTMYSEYSMYNV